MQERSTEDEREIILSGKVPVPREMRGFLQKLRFFTGKGNQKSQLINKYLQCTRHYSKPRDPYSRGPYSLKGETAYEQLKYKQDVYRINCK